MNAADFKNSPAGDLVRVEEGQWGYVPNDLPNEVVLSSAIINRLDKASRAVAMLEGVGETLANPHLLIQPFLRREAVLSSKIEGTQASISDLYRFEASPPRGATGDVKEVWNYVQALEHGLNRLKELPICIRLANEVHLSLLKGVRGEDKQPGEFRNLQVWIGATNSPIQEARFVPPPARLVPELMGSWEKFANAELEMPPLIQCGLLHYQFETIHPYFDGNGRIGRLFILLFLHAKEVLTTPLLYLSAYFERHRDEYYDHLYNVSATGNWEPWLRFFLEGVATEASDALQRSRRLRKLQDGYRGVLLQIHESANALQLVDNLFVRPYMTASLASKTLNISHAGARNILDRLTSLGFLELLPTTWPRLYVAREIMACIEISGA